MENITTELVLAKIEELIRNGKTVCRQHVPFVGGGYVLGDIRSTEEYNFFHSAWASESSRSSYKLHIYDIEITGVDGKVIYNRLAELCFFEQDKIAANINAKNSKHLSKFFNI